MTTAFAAYTFAPASAFDCYTADAIGFFEAIAIEGLEDQFIRIPAAVQRKFFGKVVFGKLATRIGMDGIVTTIRSVAYGTDWEETQGYWANAEKCFKSPFDGMANKMA